MTILIILVALIAIAYIFGKGHAQVIVQGGGALGAIVVIVILAINFLPGLWEWLQASKTAQGLGVLLFIFTIRPVFTSAWAFLTKEREKVDNQHHGEENKSELPKQKRLTPTQITIAVILIIVFFAWL